MKTKFCYGLSTLKINTASIVHKDGTENKKFTYSYLNCIFLFPYKGNVLAEPTKVARGTMGLRGTV